jgi:hypothetical protein
MASHGPPMRTLASTTHVNVKSLRLSPTVRRIPKMSPPQCFAYPKSRSSGSRKQRTHFGYRPRREADKRCLSLHTTQTSFGWSGRRRCPPPSPYSILFSHPHSHSRQPNGQHFQAGRGGPKVDPRWGATARRGEPTAGASRRGKAGQRWIHGGARLGEPAAGSAREEQCEGWGEREHVG